MEVLYSDDKFEQLWTGLGYDGWWSLTTKISIIALQGQGLPLYLNYLWALTPQNFQCPVCLRFKHQLARKEEGKLRFYLYIDHDHIMEYINKKVAEMGVYTNYHTLYREFCRFLPYVICSECNHIDSIVKANACQVNSIFTFTAQEKANLIALYKRHQHWVHVAKAVKLYQDRWSQLESNFKKLPQRIAELASADQSKPLSYRSLMKRRLLAQFDHDTKASGASYARFIEVSTAHGQKVSLDFKV